MLHGRNARRKAGSATAEFAGAMLVFALVFISILQGGALMVTAVAATNAAREGARAAVTLPPGDPYAAAARAAPQFERAVEVGGNGDSVRVVVHLKTPVLFGMVADWDWWVQSSATMRRER